MREILTLSVIVMLGLFVSVSNAQTVINIPPRVVGFREAFENVTLNIKDDAIIHSATATGSEINVLGGQITEGFSAYDGSLVNVEGGVINQLWLEGDSSLSQTGGIISQLVLSPNDPDDGASAVISGGIVGQISGDTQSLLTLSGYDFRVDGQLVEGLEDVGDSILFANFQEDSTLTGILADGTPFSQFYWRQQRNPSQVLLQRTPTIALPGPSELLITDRFDSGSNILGEGQTLIVGENGNLNNWLLAGPDSRVDINENGRVGGTTNFVGANVTVNNGILDGNAQAFDATTVSVNGGSVSRTSFYAGSQLEANDGEFGSVRAYSGATLNLNDGTYYSVDGFEGSTMNMIGGTAFGIGSSGNIHVSGGTVHRLDAHTETSNVTFSGGRFRSDGIRVNAEGGLTILGSDFKIDGVPVSGLNTVGDSTTRQIDDGLLSGTFRNGTPFAIDITPALAFDVRPGANITEPITLSVADVPPIASTSLVVPGDTPPNGLRSGQTMVLNEGGDLGDFFTVAPGASLTINGGTVGEELKIVQSQATFNGGDIKQIAVFEGNVEVDGDAAWGGGLIRGPSSSLTVRGGNWSNRSVRLESGVTFNMEAGSGNTPLESFGATVNISGGVLTRLALTEQSSAVISGGTVSDSVSLFRASDLRVEAGDINQLSAFENSTLVFAGGTVQRLTAAENSIVDVTGGNVNALSVGISSVEISGGALGDQVSVAGRSTLHLVGFDFQLDGQPIAALGDDGDSFQLQTFDRDSILTGTFSDGTPFNLAAEDHFSFGLDIADRTVTLVQGSRPSLPAEVNLSGDTNVTQLGAAEGQTVTIGNGGIVGDNFFAAPGSIVNIAGGEVGANFEAMESLVSIDGGQVDEHMDIFQGAVVNLRSGSIGRYLEIHPGGVLQMEGGEVDYRALCSGGEVRMTDGIIRSNFTVQDGCSVTLDGGRIERTVETGRDATIWVNAGQIDLSLAQSDLIVNGGLVEVDAGAGSLTQLFGGSVENSRFQAGANVEVFGGAFGGQTANFAGESFQLHGLGFEIDGVPVAGLDEVGNTLVADLSSAETIAGVLSDGSAFVFSTLDRDHLGELMFVRSATPTTEPIIDVVSSSTLQGVGDGQTVTLRDNGSLPANFTAGRGSVLNIEGGSVGTNLEAYKAQVNISGGDIMGDVDAFPQADINVTGGSVEQLNAFSQSQVDVDGGEISSLTAQEGSSTNVSGGLVDRFRFRSGATGEVSGGEILDATVSDGANLRISGGRIARVSIWGTTAIVGGDFKLNGQPIENITDTSNVNIGSDNILTGLLADGTPFFFGRASGDSINAPLGIAVVDLPAPQPGDYLASRDGIPLALGREQNLILDDGQSLPDNYVVGSGASMTVLDGASVSRLNTFGSQIDVQGGTVEGSAQIGADTSLRIAGGAVDGSLVIHDGASLTMVGGRLNASATSLPGSETSIASGDIDGSFRIAPSFSGDVTISGGSFIRTGIDVNGNLVLAGGETVRVSRDGEVTREPLAINFAPGSSVLVEGNSFFVGEQELTNLPLDEIVDLDISAISGVLADGSPFEIVPDDLVSLQVRRTNLLGDFDTDGQWTTSDVDHLCGSLAIGGDDAALDLNRDQVVDRFDLSRILELADSHVGDANVDGQVDFADFLQLSQSFGGEGNWSEGDFNCDANVGFDDFLALAAHFGSGQVQAVPEPSSWVFCLFGVCILSLLRDRNRKTS